MQSVNLFLLDTDWSRCQKGSYGISTETRAYDGQLCAGRVRSYFWQWRWSILLILLIVPGLALPQENPYKVKAAFLRNFAHYVNWPYSAFPDSAAPWYIGVLGPDPFGNTLEATFDGRSEQGRSFMVFRATSLEDLPPCHIVFIAYPDAGKRRAALNALRNKSVLTVGDAPDFLDEGGVIGFEVGERVSMNINLDQARVAALTIQTKMLEVSTGILENGVFRRMR